jgi:hypothetical protein
MSPQPAGCRFQRKGCMLGLLFKPEDEGSMFLQNISTFLLDYTTPNYGKPQIQRDKLFTVGKEKLF